MQLFSTLKFSFLLPIVYRDRNVVSRGTSAGVNLNEQLQIMSVWLRLVISTSSTAIVPQSTDRRVSQGSAGQGKLVIRPDMV